MTFFREGLTFFSGRVDILRRGCDFFGRGGDFSGGVDRPDYFKGVEKFSDGVSFF